MHGSEDRAKDASRAPDDLSYLRRVHTLAYADDVPLLGALWTSAVAGAPACRGGTAACRRTDQRPAFRRRPAKNAAFQKTGMPFTVTTREGIDSRRDAIPPAFAPALSLTPPTRSPQAGESALDRALQGHGAVTRGVRDYSRVQTPFVSRWIAPGTDDPSTPASSTDSAVDGD